VTKVLKRFLVAVVAVILVLLTVPDALLIPFTLGFGWVTATERWIQAIDPSWPQLAMIVFASVSLVCGFQWLITSLVGRVPTEAGNSQGVEWPWRWTISAFAGFWLVLLATGALTGVAHQIGWMIVSRPPIFEQRFRKARNYAGFYSAVRHTSVSAETNGWDAAKISADFWNQPPDPNNGVPAWEQQMLFLIMAGGGRAARIIVAPRDPKPFAKIGFAIIEPGGDVHYEVASQFEGLFAAGMEIGHNAKSAR
jgi:hypothetical protein